MKQIDWGFFAAVVLPCILGVIFIEAVLWGFPR